ncbi:MAG: ComEC/Rec2 family competence protein [Acidobacteria bacterium]|nr:ComEC/Rec2 family competence protein [Acidobacteriota bacterium]
MKTRDANEPDLVTRRSPFLFLAAAVAAGEVLDHQFTFPIALPCGIAAGAFFLTCAIHARSDHTRSVRFDRCATVLLTLGFVAAGTLLHRTARLASGASPLLQLYEREPERFAAPIEIKGRLATAVERAPGRAILSIRVDQIRSGHERFRARGRVRLTVAASHPDQRAMMESLRLRSGTRVAAWATVNRQARFLNPGSFDLDAYMDWTGLDLSGIIKSPRLIEVIDRSDESGLLNGLADARARGEANLDRTFPPRTAALLKALLLGNRHFIDRETAEGFRAGGTFHILVISGAHVAFIAAGLYWILKTLTRRRWIHFLALAAAVWSYALLVGLDQIPVLRATIMVCALLLGNAIFRSASLSNSVGLAALVILTISPMEIFAAGFQLTFGAMLGIALLAAPLAGRLREIGAWQPRASTPWPPCCGKVLRHLAEPLYWNVRTFDHDLLESSVRYRLRKSRWAKWLGSVPPAQALARWLVLSVLVSVSIQVMIVPASVFYFHRFSPAGILLNISIGLLALGMMTTGLLTCGLMTFLPSAAAPLREITVRLGVWMNSSSKPVLELPFAQFRVPEYSDAYALVYIGFAVGVFALAAILDQWRPVRKRLEIEMEFQTEVPGRDRDLHQNARGRDRHLPWTSMHLAGMSGSVVLVTLAIILWHPGGLHHAKGWLSVHFLDVDQGDAIFVEFPDGKNMLVDGGGSLRTLVSIEPSGMADSVHEDRPGVGEAVVAPFLWRKGLRRIDYLVPTHADADHIQGCVDIAREFAVGEVWLARRPGADPGFEPLAEVLARKKIPCRRIASGDRSIIDGVRAEVLWPTQEETPSARWGNDASVVLRLRFGSRSLLLTGDIGKAAEAGMLASEQPLLSQILKVPHHGSRTSSSLAFIQRVSPMWAIVSVGKRSPYGHPHAEVIESYRSRGVRVISTSEMGLISVETDGHRLKIESFVYGTILE